MTIQIIFFISVLLVAILLINRARRSTNLRSADNNSSFRGTSLLIKIILPVKDVTKKINNRLFSRKKMEKIPFSDSQPKNNLFWKKDHSTNELELPSHLEEGTALQKAGQLSEAEQSFLKAAANNPTDPKVYAKLGLLYLQQESYSDAIEALKIAVKLDKHNPSRHYNLSLAYWGNKDIQRATVAIREAISLDPVTEKYRLLLEQLLNREQKK